VLCFASQTVRDIEIAAMTFGDRQHHGIVKLSISQMTSDRDVLPHPQICWIHTSNHSRPPLRSAYCSARLVFVDFKQPSPGKVVIGGSRESFINVRHQDFRYPRHRGSAARAV
jgi:hypothetical protein